MVWKHSPLLDSSRWVVEPRQVLGDGTVVPAVATSYLQCKVLGYASLYQPPHCVLIKADTASVAIGL